MKNLKEFKALIKRYESITLEEIKESGGFRTTETANELTGFGLARTCTLCIYNDKNFKCADCVYYILTNHSCSDGHNVQTFYEIEGANTPTKLLNTFRARAKHMKTLIS